MNCKHFDAASQWRQLHIDCTTSPVFLPILFSFPSFFHILLLSSLLLCCFKSFCGELLDRPQLFSAQGVLCNLVEQMLNDFIIIRREKERCTQHLSVYVNRGAHKLVPGKNRDKNDVLCNTKSNGFKEWWLWQTNGCMGAREEKNVLFFEEFT